MSKTAIKSVLSGAVAVAIDHYYLSEPNLTNSLMLGGTVAFGAFLGDTIGNLIPANMNNAIFNGKTIETRILEVGGTLAVSYGASKAGLGREILPYNAYSKLATVAISDLVGTALSEYIYSEPISLFH